MLDTLGVGRRRAVTLRITDLHHPVTRCADIALADVQAQAYQVVGGLALVQHKQHIGTVERVDGLHGDMFRVAGANANQQECFHLSIPKALTLALSQRERELTVRGINISTDQLPLPPGEGWGEGLSAIAFSQSVAADEPRYTRQRLHSEVTKSTDCSSRSGAFRPRHGRIGRSWCGRWHCASAG